MSRKKNQQNKARQKTVSQEEKILEEIIEEQTLEENDATIEEQIPEEVIEEQILEEISKDSLQEENEEVEEEVTLKSDLSKILNEPKFKSIRSFVSTLISYYDDAKIPNLFKPMLPTKHKQLFHAIKKALTEEAQIRNQKLILFTNVIGTIEPIKYFRFHKEQGTWRWEQKELDACDLLISFFLNIKDEGVSSNGLRKLEFFTDEEITSLEEIQKIIKNLNA